MPDGDPSPVATPLSARLGRAVLRITIAGQVAGTLTLAGWLAMLHGGGPQPARWVVFAGLATVGLSTWLGIDRAIRRDHPEGGDPSVEELLSWSGLKRATSASGASWSLVRVWVVLDTVLVLLLVGATVIR